MKQILMWTLGVCSALSLASCNQTASQVQQPTQAAAPAVTPSPVAVEEQRPTKANPNGWTEVGPGVWEKTQGEGVNTVTQTFVDGSVESLEWTIQQDEAALSKGLAAQALDAEELKRAQENIELHRELLRKAQESEPTSVTQQAIDSCKGNPIANVRFDG